MRDFDNDEQHAGKALDERELRAKANFKRANHVIVFRVNAEKSMQLTLIYVRFQQFDDCM